MLRDNWVEIDSNSGWNQRRGKTLKNLQSSIKWKMKLVRYNE